MKKQLIENLITALIGCTIGIILILSINPICKFVLWVAERVC